MEEVIKILMKRDDIDYDTARDMVEECRDEILSSNPFDADYIIEEMLGLEPDYLFQVIGY